VKSSPAVIALLSLLCLSALEALRVAAQERPPGDVPSNAGASPDPRPLEVADYFALARLSAPRISPDSAWVAYGVSTRDREAESSEERIWMVSTEGGEPVPMTRKGESASQPRWSPDGRYLSFLAARDGGESQVWGLFRHGGDAVQLTDVPQGVGAYSWAPDGQRLALVVKDPTPAQAKAIESGEEVDEETTPPWVVTRRQFKQDYTGYLDERRDHLYVLDLESEELRRVTSGDHDHSTPVWSPDGERLAFVSNRTDDPDSNYNTDIWVIEVGTEGPAPEPLRITSNPGPDHSPAWSADGERIAYVAATDVEAIVYATDHLAVASSRGGDERVLTAKLDRWVDSPRFDSTGRILFRLEDGGEHALARIAADGGAIERLIDGRQVVGSFHLDAADSIAALISSPHLPAEVFLLRDGDPVRLTYRHEEALDGIRLGAVEKIRFPSADGTPIEGFVVKPPEFEEGRRYPTILRIHGGPQSQYDWSFHFGAQLYAAQGYVVLLPNPRGSTGYGQEFCEAIWQAWGERDYEDVMAAVDHAIERGWSDPERLGVGGWSYGGMLTNHVITRTDRFKAAVTGASATLYVVNYGHDQYQRWWEYELGLPWERESRELYERLSPFNRVEKIVTPTLILGGEKDWNVPIINSEQLFLALKRLGREVELVVYPGEFHGLSKPSYLEDLYRRRIDWYDRHVRGLQPERPAPTPF
jgi:dipeptidyl aminopeptidase/acylaminoacyl peptidase